MQNIEQFVNERQEISLYKLVNHIFLLFKKICGVSVIRFALQKTVQVDTRFYPDTDELHINSRNITFSNRLENNIFIINLSITFDSDPKKGYMSVSSG